MVQHWQRQLDILFQTDFLTANLEHNRPPIAARVLKDNDEEQEMVIGAEYWERTVFGEEFDMASCFFSIIRGMHSL